VRSALYKIKEATDEEHQASIGGSPTLKRYDIFLSHKQSDAKDFVRALHTMLTVHGYRCFLDVEFDGELGSLGEIVGQSGQLLFVLTDKVLESPWCIMELRAAVEHHVPITVIKKEGARWVEPDSGVRCLNFPSYAELNRLPEEIRPVFQIKIVEHSDTYYASFIEKLFERIQAEEDNAKEAVIQRRESKESATMMPAMMLVDECSSDNIGHLGIRRPSKSLSRRSTTELPPSAQPGHLGMPRRSTPTGLNVVQPGPGADGFQPLLDRLDRHDKLLHERDDRLAALEKTLKESLKVDRLDALENLLNERGHRLDNLEKLFHERGHRIEQLEKLLDSRAERAFLSNFLLGLVVGAFLAATLKR
jgi:hypothetical protein